MENLSYALVQLVHNFGAATVAAGPIAAAWPLRVPFAARGALLRVVALAWIVQIASGAGFGATSLYYYGTLPELSTVASAALMVKVGCAASAALLSIALWARGAGWNERAHARAWRALAVLGVVALSAAAVLRWFA